MVTDLRRRCHDTQSPSERLQLCMLGGFSLRSSSDGVPLVQGAQRLVALLALHGKWLRRSYVAGTLWGDASEEHANGSLRSALWRLRASALHVVDSAHDELRLAPAVEVDVHRAATVARGILAGAFGEDTTEMAEPRLWEELLPGWYEDWILLERERHRQLTLLALEALSEHCTDVGRSDAAVLAALAAVEREPLRESAHRALVRAHLADGNVAEAIRRFRIYEQLAQHDLGVDPSPKMTALLEGLALH
ncbi:MAG TPA: BTAD domain-containing putative transcriptional regulator [Acidimicrobiales bacterium]|nr:BTAD domain-containing putative transcriptional regulator [Acidimicrobiales bacterium]